MTFCIILCIKVENTLTYSSKFTFYFGKLLQGESVKYQNFFYIEKLFIKYFSLSFKYNKYFQSHIAQFI